MAAPRQEIFDRTDRWLLILAGIAVALYLADLRGVWRLLDMRTLYLVVSIAIDTIFVIDLVAKIAVMRRSYLRSPWFVIDLLSALPLLASLEAAPHFVEALRFVRGVRLFRMLRMLRTLRVLRSIRLFKFVAPPPENSPERRIFERTLFTSVLVYTGTFLAIMTVVGLSDPGEPLRVRGPNAEGIYTVDVRKASNEIERIKLTPDLLIRTSEEIEFYFVLGSVLGMLLISVVARAQVPAIAAHQVRALLNVALPSQVAEHFMKQPEAYDRTVRMPVTVVFCDIQGFTTTVEAIGDDLEALKRHLELALDAVVQVHQRYDLIVDKFIGDAVMSFRGGPLVPGTPEEHAFRVVRASMDARKALVELGDPYFHTVRIGGASAEDVLIGTFGTSSRLSYTVLGDRVNLASRLEAASGPLGTANLFCDRTQALTADRPEIRWRRVGRLVVQGKKEAVPVFEAFDANDALDWLPLFEAALADYEAGHFQSAADGFEAADGARAGGDATSRFYGEKCAALLEATPAPGWTPVLALRK